MIRFSIVVRILSVEIDKTLQIFPKLSLIYFIYFNWYHRAFPRNSLIILEVFMMMKWTLLNFPYIYDIHSSGWNNMRLWNIWREFVKKSAKWIWCKVILWNALENDCSETMIHFIVDMFGLGVNVQLSSNHFKLILRNKSQTSTLVIPIMSHFELCSFQ